MTTAVTPCTPDHIVHLQTLFDTYGLHISPVADGLPIPGSYWGDSEAGLIGDCLFLRGDTPLHSALHEACHYICMDPGRRGALHTDAGGEIIEENAVCYLQGLLADQIPGYGRETVFADMDAWGYSFRLGCARHWFEQDADDARHWLMAQGIIDHHHRPTGQLAR